ncbi:MAG TPA: two-component system response regulator [Syntrophorhabdaceae bacterium]|nr:two-component system response regulator [Syntrophorhabdaceae bacterium]HPC67757.1 two-component system response regulator [Syntrophorhabdaceae bacterium]HQH43242.1 two-component system response regulator [Syntrophorhabdaceae bacterium]HQK47532.1 two-component system response regulator [Syntrophorhabdaceae bacterium]HRV23584.1 two-component system response regulator [Syntrophorhabdaceae bacterium]
MSELIEQPKKHSILVVDDSPDIIVMLSTLLKDLYRTKFATSGEKALKMLSLQDKPDLVLLDIVMPGMDGYEVCREIKANPDTSDIPVIFLTSQTGIKEEKKGFELGAVDYITKPISPPILLARINTHIMLKEARDFLKDKNKYLEQEVLKRTEEIVAIQDVTIMALASLAETRDTETGNHIKRTQTYIKLLAMRLKDKPRFKHFLTDENIELLYKSAPLHDIGKVGVPDNILLKPAKLTPEEFDIMQRHTVLGRDAIISAEKRIGQTRSFLNIAREIAYSHQERWSGTGYPEGLAGDDIPISARLMAVADVYDALISRRIYKPAFPHEQAVEIIKSGYGINFDPDVVDAFLDISDKCFEIAQKYSTAEEDIKRK